MSLRLFRKTDLVFCDCFGRRIKIFAIVLGTALDFCNCFADGSSQICQREFVQMTGML